MSILILVDRKDTYDQKEAIEGSYAYCLSRWCRNAGINMQDVEVLRLGDNKYDEEIFEDSTADDYIRTLNPSMIIGLGRMSLMYLKGREAFQFTKKGECIVSLDDQRGAPFLNRINGCPTICTYTPRYIFMLYALETIVQSDFNKAARLHSTGWSPPEYSINFIPTYGEAMSRLQQFYDENKVLSVDIETRKTGKMTCIGFADSESTAFVLPFEPFDYGTKRVSYNAEEMRELLQMTKRVLEHCPCVGHNAVHFDHYDLYARYGILTRFIGDSMFGFWELYPSYEKSLGFVSSMLTDNMYWKGMLKESRTGKCPRWKEFEYNGLDCIIAYQCWKEIHSRLKANDDLMNHYKFNIRVSRAYNYMSKRGCCIDKEKLNQMKIDTLKQINDTQEELNASAGKSINVKSPKQMKEWLYHDLRLPIAYKAKKDKFGNREQTETADALSVYKAAGEHPEIPALGIAAKLRKLHKKMSGLEGIETDEKGICHWSFNCCGTKVGRSSGSKPLIEAGVQPQNVDKAFRDLFIPPDGMVWVKADLEGADSVTMGACMKALGEPLLMDDIKHRIKPAQTVALELMTGEPFTQKSQEEIKAAIHLLKEPKGKKFYKITKAVNHGSAYMLGFDGMSDNMLRISEGELYVSPKDCKTYQQKLFSRYNYKRYHLEIEKIMRRDPMLKAANGQTRIFYGRADNAMCREMCSYLPQVHTAYVTNKVIERFYYDKAARKGDRLLLQLCNQVHDELCGFVYEDEVDEVERLFKEFCYVPLSIWGVDFIIEFEAQCGPTWGTMTRDFKLYE